jgi:hypothetical protein
MNICTLDLASVVGRLLQPHRFRQSPVLQAGPVGPSAPGRTLFSAVPQDLFIFIGVCEFLGGVGLILPAMTGVKPRCPTGKA